MSPQKLLLLTILIRLFQMRKASLTKEEKENRVYDEMTFFVEKLERKYKVVINYNVDVE